MILFILFIIFLTYCFYLFIVVDFQTHFAICTVTFACYLYLYLHVHSSYFGKRKLLNYIRDPGQMTDRLLASMEYH
jgi:hypothetical protein